MLLLLQGLTRFFPAPIMMGIKMQYGIPSHPEAIIPQNEAMLLIFSG